MRGREFKKHTDVYDYLRTQGLPVIETFYVCRTADEVWHAVEAIGELRGELAYDIDGAVVKFYDLDTRRRVPDSAKISGGMISYKYPPDEIDTVLRDIELSVGRTGRVTPTAVFDPVRLCGTTVSRATLHNQDYIDELDVGIGDTVLVYKSGEIIPKVRAVVPEKRPAQTERFRIPDTCPICGAPVVREADTADMRCTGSACPAQMERHLINFVSRDAMDIRGFGEKYIRVLMEKSYLTDVADLYHLKEHREELIEQGLTGRQKNTDKLLAAIDASRSNEPDRLLTGLGIPNVGKTAARSLVQHFQSIHRLADASREELQEVDDIGEITAEAVYSYFHSEETRQLLDRLREAGVNMTGQQAEAPSGGPLEGKTFVITGTLPGMSRKEAEALILAHGGRVTGSVSKKTDYLLAGENAGSKLTKAESLGTTILSEEDLMSMTKGTNGEDQ